jgi:4-hydroxybenzoate polyprenyltransferase
LYTPVALRYPLIKGVYVAGLCCAPLYYGAVVGGTQYPWFLYVVLACFVLGREVLMDADELPGDSRAGVRTIAAVLGRRRAARIGATLMILSAAVLVAVVRGRIETLAAIGALVCLACVFAWPGLEGSRRIHLSRFPMLLGCMALACGGT